MLIRFKAMNRRLSLGDLVEAVYDDYSRKDAQLLLKMLFKSRRVRRLKHNVLR